MIPANIEKPFDQIDLGLSHILDAGAFPIIIGGDHCIGFPDAKGVAKHVEGKLGIIHFDRHIDTAETTMDERMHTTHWSHATNLPNVPATNLVQIGIGGWIGNHFRRQGSRGTRYHRDHDVRCRGARRGSRNGDFLGDRMEDATAVYLSFDIDVVDPGYGPGTGTPEPGEMSPREALKAVRMVAAEGLAGVDLVEIAPPYDVADTTSQLGARLIMDTLASLVEHGHLGNRLTRTEREQAERERDRAAGI